MSNGWKLELLPDGEGGAYLNFWDHLHGEDRLWMINADGAAWRQASDEFQSAAQSDEPIYIPVELEEELIKLLNWLIENRDD